MKTWIPVALLVFVCYFQKGDAVTTWTTPVIAAATGNGALSLAEDQALNTPITTYAAAGGTGNVAYSIPTAVAPFSLTSAGILTITAALDFETTPTYTFEVEAVDSAGTPVTGTATIAVTVTNVAPAFSNTPYSACVVDGSGGGTSVIGVTATDSGGTAVTYVEADASFAFDGSVTNVIDVATGVTLSKANSPTTLQITVHDGALTSTTTVTITIADSCCSSAVAVVVSMMTVLAALFVNMF